MRQARLLARRTRRAASAGDPQGALQRIADASPVQRRLAQLQQQAGAVFQRVGDEDEVAPAPDPVPVILSMDGAMIGSVYFETGRIRATHPSGPADERGEHEYIERFNIDMALAEEAYELAVEAEEHEGLPLNHWISDKLWDSADQPWVLEQIGRAEDMEEGPAPANATLFENFGEFTGEEDNVNLAGHHPSRGAAIKEMMPTSDVRALETAVEQAKKGTGTEKNRAFYVSLLKNAPQLALRVRMPEEIAAEDAEYYAEYALESEGELAKIVGVDTSEYESAALKPHVTRFNKKRKQLKNLIGLCRQAAGDAEDVAYRADFKLRASIQARAINAGVRARSALERIALLETRLETLVGEMVRKSGGKIKKPARVVADPVEIPDWVKD